MKMIGEIEIFGIDMGTDERATGCDHYGFVEITADEFRIARCTHCGADLHADDVERLRRWMQQDAVP